MKALYARGYQLLTVASDAVLLTRHAGALVARFRDEIGRDGAL